MASLVNARVILHTLRYIYPYILTTKVKRCEGGLVATATKSQNATRECFPLFLPQISRSRTPLSDATRASALGWCDFFALHASTLAPRGTRGTVQYELVDTSCQWIGMASSSHSFAIAFFPPSVCRLSLVGYCNHCLSARWGSWICFG